MSSAGSSCCSDGNGDKKKKRKTNAYWDFTEVLFLQHG